MKTLRFLSVFAIFGILLSCSAPKASSSRTYSKDLIAGKTYVGEWSGTFYAVKFSNITGNTLKANQNSGNDQNTAVNGLNSAKEWQVDLDTNTGDIMIYEMQGSTMMIEGIKYRIQNENEIERLVPSSLDANAHIVYNFGGSLKLYKKN